jgi:hypothetical protein
MLTPDDIKKVSALASRHAEERTALACRQANEREEIETRHKKERDALGIGQPAGAPSAPPLVGKRGAKR